jgi:serine kinase of HPr protein (carbohydrate metabolism regulator)
LIEVRGVGVERVESVFMARIGLKVRCVAESAGVERMPELRVETLVGVAVASIDLWPFERAAPAKLRRALEGLGRRAQQAYQATLARPGGAWGL